MNDLRLFLTTEVEDFNILAALGNLSLTPARYLFHGKTISIVTKGQINEVHHVMSFHKSGRCHQSKTSRLVSDEKTFLKTVFSIILLIPCLILGLALKGLSYLSASVREKHNLAKLHLTPINVNVGSRENPLNEKEIKEALSKISSDPLHQKIHAIIVYGKVEEGHPVEFNQDPGFIKLSPKKIVLVNAEVVHRPGYFRLDEALIKSKWPDSTIREIKFYEGMSASDSTKPFVNQVVVKSVEEALAHEMPRRPYSLTREKGLYLVKEE